MWVSSVLCLFLFFPELSINRVLGLCFYRLGIQAVSNTANFLIRKNKKIMKTKEKKMSEFSKEGSKRR